MGKITKPLLFTSIIALFSGAILLGAGYATRGVDAIQKITAPTKKTETFTDISDIQLGVEPGLDVVIQSGNVDKPTVSYYDGSKFIANVHLEQKDKILSITSNYSQNIVAGGIEVFGYLLNEAREDHSDIVITLPKDKPLNSIQGSAWSRLAINNMQVKTVNYSNSVDMYNSSISGGKISGVVQATDSTLKDVTIESNYSYSNISNSTLENVKIISESGGITIANSTLKNSSFSNGQSEEEIEAEFTKNKEENDGYYNQSHYSNVSLEKTTLIGDNSFIAYTLDIDVELASDSKEKTSLALQSTGNDIRLGDAFKALDATKQDGKNSLTHTVQDATGKLIIKNISGTIDIK